MTPDRLSALLEDRLPNVQWPPVSDAIELLRALEVAADNAPQDRLLSEAVVHVHGLVSAGMGLPVVIGGVRREAVIRWDHWTVTFEGSCTKQGGAAMVRTLRPWAARDPVLRRALQREGRALRAVIPELELVGGSQPALVVSLPGPVAVTPNYATADVLIRAKVIERTLEELRTWEEAGLGLPRVGLAELRDTQNVIQIVCLTAIRETDARNLLADVACLLDPFDYGGDSPIDALVAGFRIFPPHSYGEARDLWVAALSAHLAQARQDLARRAADVSNYDRHTRLGDAVRRLFKSLPAPVGRGHIGVNLDGEVTIVESTGDSVWWGVADGELSAVFTPMGGFSPRDARRMLRARASAPRNARLEKQVNGDPKATEDICRWVAAGMQLRTIRLLLQAAA